MTAARFCFVLLALFAQLCASDGSELLELERDYLAIEYGSASPQDQRPQIEALRERADRYLSAESSEPRELILRARILSHQASLSRGFKGLGIAKQAKALLEKSLQIDEAAQNGLAHVFLGLLYDNIPGRPAGFGDKLAAHKHLQRAVELDPQGFDANYQLANFLLRRKQPGEAFDLLEAAKLGLSGTDPHYTEKLRRLERLERRCHKASLKPH